MISSSKNISFIKLLSDFLLLTISFILSAIVAQDLQTLLDRPQIFVLLFLLYPLWYFSTSVSGFYESFTGKLFSYQFMKILRAVVVQVLTAVLFIFLIKEDLFTRNFIIYYAFSLTFLVSLRTIFVIELISFLHIKGKNVRNLLVIGAGEVGQSFKAMVTSSPDMGFEFKGFLDDNSELQDSLGTISDLQKIFERYEIHEVMIALPIDAFEKIESIIKLCDNNGVRAHIIPDFFRFLTKKYQISMIDKFPVITVRKEPLEQLQWRFVKRTFDIVVSFLAILFIGLWLFPIIAVIIKLTSRGTVFFIQDRVGRNGEIFACYKFRTMRAETNQTIYEPVLSVDTRVTGIGRFLRKSNIDELPQIFNVLLGSMSIVGPRPHSIAYDTAYTQFVDYLKVRNFVKPGITGWAQAHGLRGDSADESENKRLIEKRIQFDIWYIENWSFALDLQIILLTVWQIVRGKISGR